MVSTVAGRSDQLVRLNKLLVAKIGLSRREADTYIGAGWVRLNGATVLSGVGTKVDATTVATLDLTPEGRAHRLSHCTTVILHKPLGIVSCMPETKEQVPAIRLLSYSNMFRGGRDSRGGMQHIAKVEPCRLQKLAVAGRLDVNSSGLLIFTQCGKTASDIIGGNSTVEKEYLVRLNPLTYGVSALTDETGSGELDERIERLRHGIECNGELLEAVSVDILNADQLRIALKAGKKHHIRRMVEAVGWSVQALKRVRIGNVSLGHLPRGQWRYLKPTEVVI